MWHMSSRSGVATLRTAIHLYLLTYFGHKFVIIIIVVVVSNVGSDVMLCCVRVVCCVDTAPSRVVRQQHQHRDLVKYLYGISLSQKLRQKSYFHCVSVTK